MLGVDLHCLLLATLFCVAVVLPDDRKTVIDGFEAAWAFFGGVFAVVIPDYVARHIIGLLFPTGLCSRTGSGAVITVADGA